VRDNDWFLVRWHQVELRGSFDLLFKATDTPSLDVVPKSHKGLFVRLAHHPSGITWKDGQFKKNNLFLPKNQMARLSTFDFTDPFRLNVSIYSDKLKVELVVSKDVTYNILAGNYEPTNKKVLPLVLLAGDSNLSDFPESQSGIFWKEGSVKAVKKSYFFPKSDILLGASLQNSKASLMGILKL
jgi:hypothetical protein